MTQPPVPAGIPDPTAGMSVEERLGHDLVSALEGRLVTDDTFREHSRKLDATLAAIRRQLLWTRVVGAGLAVALAAAALWARGSATTALDAAAASRMVARCNEFRLMAVADGKVDPMSEALGCDMELAKSIIANIDAGTETAVNTEKRLAELEAIARE